MITTSQIESALQEIKDPEIPTISIVDLGIVRNIQIESDSVKVTLTPTFAGCPALNLILEEVRKKLLSLGVEKPEVIMSYKEPWNSDMISEYGKEMLKKHGITPPPVHNGLVNIEILSKVECPNCGSKNTILKSPFGPTLCRSLHYCKDCSEAFEQFKPVA